MLNEDRVNQGLALYNRYTAQLLYKVKIYLFNLTNGFFSVLHDDDDDAMRSVYICDGVG